MASSSKNLPAIQREPIIDLFKAVGLTKRDRFTLDYRDNFINVTVVRHQTNEVQSVRLHASGAFTEATSFNPEKLTLAQRRSLTRDLYEDKRSQAEIADLLGVSQATVSLDLRREK